MSRYPKLTRGGGLVGVLSLLLAAGSVQVVAAPASSAAGRVVQAVGAENEYANVIAQIGGPHVHVVAIESNPNTDPHQFEASPSVAQAVAGAQLVVQNGVGYDTYMNQIEAASPSSQRKVITVQTLLKLPDSTANPHLWYKPSTMPAVAQAVARDLSALDPTDKAYFAANVTKFDASLQPWYQSIAKLKATYPNAAVAVTEPVGDYLLQAAGTDIETPWNLQADIMNGVDPSAQNITTQNQLFSQHKVKVFVYNQQVVDSLTQSFLNAAKSAGIPVVGVYETMPTPGYTYQSWMLAETNALQKALADKISTQRL